MVSNYYSATPLAFPSWQREYEALVSETDDDRIPERASTLETALFNREQELPHDAYASTERVAIDAATRTLRTIQEEKLGFPKWEKRAS
jgi:hypothetical protein